MRISCRWTLRSGRYVVRFPFIVVMLCPLALHFTRDDSFLPTVSSICRHRSIPSSSSLLSSPRRRASNPWFQRQADRSTLAGRRHKCAPPRYLLGQRHAHRACRPASRIPTRILVFRRTPLLFIGVVKLLSYAHLFLFRFRPPTLFCSFSLLILAIRPQRFTAIFDSAPAVVP